MASTPITRTIIGKPPSRSGRGDRPAPCKSGTRRKACRKAFAMRSLALVVLLALATAAPAQPETQKPRERQDTQKPSERQAKSAAGGRTANLPDFTALMKQQ